MNKTFEIKFLYDKSYQILSQPERNFDCHIGGTFVASCSYPCADPSNIFLRGGDYSRDNCDVKYFTGHLKVLEELCRIRHWRFVICI